MSRFSASTARKRPKFLERFWVWIIGKSGGPPFRARTLVEQIVARERLHRQDLPELTEMDGGLEGFALSDGNHVGFDVFAVDPQEAAVGGDARCRGLLMLEQFQAAQIRVPAGAADRRRPGGARSAPRLPAR